MTSPSLMTGCGSFVSRKNFPATWRFELPGARRGTTHHATYTPVDIPIGTHGRRGTTYAGVPGLASPPQRVIRLRRCCTPGRDSYGLTMLIVPPNLDDPFSANRKCRHEAGGRKRESLMASAPVKATSRHITTHHNTFRGRARSHRGNALSPSVHTTHVQVLHLGEPGSSGCLPSNFGPLRTHRGFPRFYLS